MGVPASGFISEGALVTPAPPDLSLFLSVSLPLLLIWGAKGGERRRVIQDAFPAARTASQLQLLNYSYLQENKEGSKGNYQYNVPC